MLLIWEWEEESKAKVHKNYVKDDLRQVSEQRTTQIMKMCAQNGKMSFPELAVLRSTFCVYVAILQGFKNIQSSSLMRLNAVEIHGEVKIGISNSTWQTWKAEVHHESHPSAKIISANHCEFIVVSCLPAAGKPNMVFQLRVLLRNGGKIFHSIKALLRF